MHQLNDDVLRLIIGIPSLPRDHRKTVSALSQTSRRIRALCLPVLYSTLEIRLGFDEEFEDIVSGYLALE